MKKKINSLYIHIPFCNQICPYCDFTKIINNSNFQNKYINELVKDIIETKNKFESFNTIYIGGGTPSALSTYNLEKLLTSLRGFLNKGGEFTIEANPEDINDIFLRRIKNYGVNRLSIGIQSFDRETLKILHRSDVNFAKKIALAKKYIDNINLDFIYGLPNEDFLKMQNNLEEFKRFDVNHISIYSLIVSPHTEFYLKGIHELDEESSRKYYDFISDYLISNGYVHYEISNFAKPGYESKHNLNYWLDNEYVALGIGASGYIDNYRYTNSKSLTDYLKGKRNKDVEILTIKDKREDFIMLNLRTMYGIDLAKYEDIFKENLLNKYKRIIDELVESNLLIIKNNHLIATKSGFPVLDFIIRKFF